MTTAGLKWSAVTEIVVREVAHLIKGNWNEAAWNKLLADGTVLSIRLGTAGLQGCDSLVDSDTCVVGRKDTMQVWQGVHHVIQGKLSLDVELVKGGDVVLLGHLMLRREATDDGAASPLPVVLFLSLNDRGKIEKVALAAINLFPLAEAIVAAAQSGTPYSETRQVR